MPVTRPGSMWHSTQPCKLDLEELALNAEVEALWGGFPPNLGKAMGQWRERLCTGSIPSANAGNF